MTFNSPIKFEDTTWNCYNLQNAIHDYHGPDSAFIQKKFESYNDHIHRAYVAAIVMAGLAAVVFIAGTQWQNYLSLGNVVLTGSLMVGTLAALGIAGVV